MARGSYEQAWMDLKRRQIVMFIAGAPFSLSMILNMLFRETWPVPRLEFVFEGVIPFFVAAAGQVWYWTFRCSRCDLCFTWTWLWRPIWPRECPHCGLPKGASKDRDAISQSRA